MGRSKKEIIYEINKNNCWICKSHYRDKWGYPIYNFNNVPEHKSSTHMSRYIYLQYKGQIPTGMIIRHICDNPGCINPDHLLLGTDADNVKDRMERGRFVALKGEKHGMAKLTDKQVKNIMNDKRFYYIIAKDYNVSDSTIGEIKRGATWKYIQN